MEVAASLSMDTHPLVTRYQPYKLSMNRDSSFEELHQELITLGKRRDLNPAITKIVAVMLETYPEVEAPKIWKERYNPSFKYTERQYRLVRQEKLLSDLLAKEREDFGPLADFRALMSMNLHLRYGDYETTTTLLSTIESQGIACGKRTETEDPTRMTWEIILKSLEHEKEIEGQYEDTWTHRQLRAEPRLPIIGLLTQVAELCHISFDLPRRGR
jgi:hypothetical protein